MPGSRGFSFICETTIITFISQCGTSFCRKLKEWCWPQNKNISSKLKWQLRISFYWGWHYNKYFSVLCLSLSLCITRSLSLTFIFLSIHVFLRGIPPGDGGGYSRRSGIVGGIRGINPSLSVIRLRNQLVIQSSINYYHRQKCEIFLINSMYCLIN